MLFTSVATDLKFEELSKVELVRRGRGVGHVADEDVGAELLDLVLQHVVDSSARHQLRLLLRKGEDKAVRTSCNIRVFCAPLFGVNPEFISGPTGATNS